ncbi:MAG: hypothetical protein ABI978_01640 [Chloroflexota bacterium]
MPELLRRTSLRIIVAALVIGLLAPLSARSATPLSLASEHLMAAADQPSNFAARAAV